MWDAGCYFFVNGCGDGVVDVEWNCCYFDTIVIDWKGLCVEMVVVNTWYGLWRSHGCNV